MIDIDTLEKWWSVILDKEKSLSEDFRGPLVNLCNSEVYYNLRTLQSLEFNVNSSRESISTKPAFKNLSEEILLSLRKNIYTDTNIDLVSQWGEKLMRYCEVWYSDLKKRGIGKWGSKLVVQLSFLQISAFLLDFYYYSKDIRFLNTVLKLSDLQYIVQKRNIKKNLHKSGLEFVSALFQIRIVLMAECAVSQLSKEEMI